MHAIAARVAVLMSWRAQRDFQRVDAAGFRALSAQSVRFAAGTAADLLHRLRAAAEARLLSSFSRLSRHAHRCRPAPPSHSVAGHLEKGLRAISRHQIAAHRGQAKRRRRKIQKTLTVSRGSTAPSEGHKINNDGQRRIVVSMILFRHREAAAAATEAVAEEAAAAAAERIRTRRRRRKKKSEQAHRE